MYYVNGGYVKLEKKEDLSIYCLMRLTAVKTIEKAMLDE